MLYSKIVVPIFILNKAKMVPALHVPLHCSLLPELNGPGFVLFGAFASVVYEAKLEMCVQRSKLYSLCIQLDRTGDILCQPKLSSVIIPVA